MRKTLFPVLLFIIIIVSCRASETGTNISTDNPTDVPMTKEALPPTAMNKPLISDGGLISDQPCPCPCFFGIRIGETRLKQVIPTLEKTLSSTCIQDNDKVICGDSVFVWVDQSTTIVDTIGFEPSKTVLLQDVIDKYGQPNLVHVIPSGIPEAPTTSMLLFFDSIMMRLHIPDLDGVEYVVLGQSKVEWVTYLDETAYVDLRENIFSQPWTGYGTYIPDED